MNPLNKLLVIFNTLFLAGMNYSYLLWSMPSVQPTVLGAESTEETFEVITSKYKLELQGEYLTTEISSNQLLQESGSGSYILSQAYNAPHDEMFTYKILIPKTAESQLYEVNVRSLSNNKYKLFLYTNTENEETSTGSFIKETTIPTGTGSMMKQKNTNCREKDIDILTVNIDLDNCITENIEEKIEFKDININNNEYKINKIVSKDLLALITNAYKDRIELHINSAYRSQQEQTELEEEMQILYGETRSAELVARPGHSEHHLGTAIDFTSPEVGTETAATFGDTKAYMWLLENAWEYGFALSYPQNKATVTGYTYEPWHWRYIGRMHSQIFREYENLTLNEYLKLVENAEKLY